MRRIVGSNERRKKKELKRPEPDFHNPRCTIGRMVMDARMLQNMTQEELAMQTGVPLSNIKVIETGKGNPNLDMLEKLAKGLGMQLKVAFVPDLLLEETLEQCKDEKNWFVKEKKRLEMQERTKKQIIDEMGPLLEQDRS